ncbi:MAG: DUF1698 domain-containing protein, partial [Geitlerinemataceae cyanobacterium]
MEMLVEEIKQEIERLKHWYHKIDLGDGLVTPGLNFDSLWNLIRATRRNIDYHNKVVLDIGSFDGLWAFEAEKLGARMTIATDCFYKQYQNFLFCRQVLKSNVIPYYNISPYNLAERLDVYLQEKFEVYLQHKYEDRDRSNRLFDIVQNLGLLYHVRDPMFVLSQSRSVIKTGGFLLLETAIIDDQSASFMVYNGCPPERDRIYSDMTTWWAPTVSCLKELLKSSLFEPLDSTIKILKQSPALPGQRFAVSRICLIAKAIAPTEIDRNFSDEILRTYRNPG